MTAQQFDFETVKQLTTGAIPFAERAGIELLEFERGRVKMKIPFEGNQNHVGMMYAGALFTLAEIPGGALFMSAFDMTKFFPIVTEMNIKFQKPALTDITVEASLTEDEIERITREAEENGKAVFNLDLALKNTSGDIVSVTTATYQARSHQRR